MTKTSTSSDIVNSEPFSLSVPIIKNSYSESHSKSHFLLLLPNTLQEGLNKYLIGNKNFQLNRLSVLLLQDPTGVSANPALVCQVKSALGNSYACRKNIHQYGLSRKWRLNCSVEIYSSYYPTYIPYFTFRVI